MRRRRLLGHLGTAAGLGLTGCTTLGSPDDPGTNPDPTPTPEDRFAERTPRTMTTDLEATHRVGTVVELPDGGRVGVSAVQVRNASIVRVPSTGGRFEALFAGSNTQYVEARTVREGPVIRGTPRRNRDAFSLAIDGRTFEPGLQDRQPARGIRKSLDGGHVFGVPTDLEPSAAAIIWTGRGEIPDQRFELDDTHRRALELEPAFGIERFSVDDRARPAGEDGTAASVDVSVTVTNTGERAGEFVGLLELPPSRQTVDYQPTSPVRIQVPRGGRTTRVEQVTWAYPPADSGTVRLDWSGQPRSASVSFDRVPDGGR